MVQQMTLMIKMIWTKLPEAVEMITLEFCFVFPCVSPLKFVLCPFQAVEKLVPATDEGRYERI